MPMGIAWAVGVDNLADIGARNEPWREPDWEPIALEIGIVWEPPCAAMARVSDEVDNVDTGH